MTFKFLPLLLVAGAAHANNDSKPGEETHDFAGLDCKMSWTIPKGDGPKHPNYTLRCEKFGKRIFILKDFGAQKFFASEDGKFLVGLSNSGLHKYAYWIVTRIGEVMVKKEHGASGITYCQSTGNLIRNWANLETPVEFATVEGEIKAIFVNTCDGKKNMILEEIDIKKLESSKPTSDGSPPDDDPPAKKKKSKKKAKKS